MDIELVLECFPEKIEEIDQRVRDAIDEVVSWEYSYVTQKFSLDVRGRVNEEEKRKIEECVRKEVEECL